MHPREQQRVIGHNKAEKAILEAITEDRLHHAWLLTGAQGVGKATLAYRFIKYLVANPSAAGEQEAGLFGDALPSEPPTSLDANPDLPEVGWVEEGAHPNIKLLEPTNLDESGKQLAGFELRVYQVRKLNDFLGQTASSDGWRFVVVDSVDDMNRNAANALLKMLEEPPHNTIFILVSHVPGRLLPTIRSRCRVLSLQPLTDAEVEQVIEHQEPDMPQEVRQVLVRMSTGSPGRALELYESGVDRFVDPIVQFLSQAPRLNVAELEQFCTPFAGKNGLEDWHTAIYVLRFFLQGAVRCGVGVTEKGRLSLEQPLYARLLAHYSVDELLDMWEKVGQLASETEGLHMDRGYATMQMMSELV